jgi:hypothetical protein
MSGQQQQLQVQFGDVSPEEAEMARAAGIDPDTLLAVHAPVAQVGTQVMQPDGTAVMVAVFLLPGFVFKAHKPSGIVLANGQTGSEPIVLATVPMLRMIVSKTCLQTDFATKIEEHLVTYGNRPKAPAGPATSAEPAPLVEEPPLPDLLLGRRPVAGDPSDDAN